MGRTPGATNRSWREVEAEGKRLLEKAKYMKKVEALKKEVEQAKIKPKRG